MDDAVSALAWNQLQKKKLVDFYLFFINIIIYFQFIYS